MRLFFLTTAIFICFAGKSFANPAPTPNAAEADTAAADLATFADINIFSNMPLGSVFILWSNFDMEADIKRQITSRSFVLEPYFMQNIDREQFEQKQVLHLFELQKREFFKLFPDDEEED